MLEWGEGECIQAERVDGFESVGIVCSTLLRVVSIDCFVPLPWPVGSVSCLVVELVELIAIFATFAIAAGVFVVVVAAAAVVTVLSPPPASSGWVRSSRRTVSVAVDAAAANSSELYSG